VPKRPTCVCMYVCLYVCVYVCVFVRTRHSAPCCVDVLCLSAIHLKLNPKPYVPHA
jgi:hypothetical protein